MFHFFSPSPPPPPPPFFFVPVSFHPLTTPFPLLFLPSLSLRSFLPLAFSYPSSCFLATSLPPLILSPPLSHPSHKFYSLLLFFPLIISLPSCRLPRSPSPSPSFPLDSMKDYLEDCKKLRRNTVNKGSGSNNVFMFYLNPALHASLHLTPPPPTFPGSVDVVF